MIGMIGMIGITYYRRPRCWMREDHEDHEIAKGETKQLQACS